MKHIPQHYDCFQKRVLSNILTSGANLRKYSVDNPVGEGMITIFDEIFLINMEIMVAIEFPKSAVYNVEMLIGEVPVKQKKCHIE